MNTRKLACTLACVLLPTIAAAEQTAAGDTKPELLHTPPISAAAGTAVSLLVQTKGDWHLTSMSARVRVAGSTGFETLPLKRVKSASVEVTIPARLVQPPGFEYALVSEGRDGTARDHFASEDTPHRVNVFGESIELAERRELIAHDGHRSQFAVHSELVSFGPRNANVPNADEPVATDDGSDRYWHLRAAYTYRPLARIYDFRFGFGVMRGNWSELDGEAIRDEKRPGLNYGFSEVTLRLAEHFSAGGRVLFGASAEGFVAGYGAVAHIGQLAGTHVALELEWIDNVGTRADARFRWTTVPRAPMALGIEFTEWPDDSGPSATVLAYDIGWQFGEGHTVGARIGVANRSDSLDPGYTAGLSYAAEF